MDEIKRAGYLYPKLLDLDNINKAYKVVRSNCRNKRIVSNFDRYRCLYLYRIFCDLYLNKYELSKYNIFIISEPKYRLIMSDNIKDKIVNHLICDCILLPALSKKLIDGNVATRKNRGSGLANKLLRRYMNTLRLKHDKIYVLKMDVKKYFYNINHDILKKMLRKDIKDKFALDLIYKVIDSTNEGYINREIDCVRNKEIKRVSKLKISAGEKNKKIKELKDIPLYFAGKGLGIGNMTSQILAVYYLNELDHFIKEDLGCKYYVRYMDDLIILDYDEKFLKYVFEMVSSKVLEYGLTLNKKSGIYRLSRGFSFLGYTYKTFDGLVVRINNGTYRKIRKHLNNLYNNDRDKYYRSVISYKGFFEHKTQVN